MITNAATATTHRKVNLNIALPAVLKMNFKKLIPFAKTEMQKMTDEEFVEASKTIIEELTEEVKRRELEDETIEAILNATA